MSNWTIFSNHGHVLFCLARDSKARLRDVATDVGITERAVQKIVRDLQDGGMISVTKSGRRNCYRIHKKKTLRHQLEASCKLRDLIKVVNKEPKPEPSDALSEDEAQKSKTNELKPRDNVVDTGLVSEVTPRPVPSESIKRKPDKTEAEKPETSESTEKQQGSLF